MSCKDEASAIGGKTARACDNCVRKRARWYCTADDAFLCKSCDASVHSANPLANRHQRVLLKVASTSKHIDIHDAENLAPSWHGGFKRKARTPRHGKLVDPHKSKEPSTRQVVLLVPELGADETSQEENSDEQLLYRVPVYNPFAAELQSTSNSPAPTKDGEVKALLAGYGQDVDNLEVFLPSDVDLAEFAADVESLLGGGECYGMEGLGLMMECKEEEYFGKVKLEVDHMACHGGDADVDMTREAFELDFDYDSPAEEKVAVAVKSGEHDGGCVKKKRKILLNLDYESVILEWASQRSPWTTGSRPEFDSDDCWPDCMKKNRERGVPAPLMPKGGRAAAGELHRRPCFLVFAGGGLVSHCTIFNSEEREKPPVDNFCQRGKREPLSGRESFAGGDRCRAWFSPEKEVLLGSNQEVNNVVVA